MDRAADGLAGGRIARELLVVQPRAEFEPRVIERLKAEGIEIPFPQRDLNIKFGDEHEPVAVLAEKLGAGMGGAASQAEAAEVSTTKPAAPKRSRKKAASRMKADSMDDGGNSDGGDR